MRSLLQRWVTDRSGATAIEYCLIASMLALSIVAGTTGIGTKLKGIFTQIAAVN